MMMMMMMMMMTNMILYSTKHDTKFQYQTLKFIRSTEPLAEVFEVTYTKITKKHFSKQCFFAIFVYVTSTTSANNFIQNL